MGEVGWGGGSEDVGGEAGTRKWNGDGERNHAQGMEAQTASCMPIEHAKTCLGQGTHDTHYISPCTGKHGHARRTHTHTHTTHTQGLILRAPLASECKCCINIMWLQRASKCDCIFLPGC